MDRPNSFEGLTVMGCRLLEFSLRMGLIAAGICCVWSTGCTPRESAEAQAHVDRDEQHHALEHGIPDHKPQAFADAVQQLPIRADRLAKEITTGDAEHAARAHQELLDIVRWLPELAADTDLKQREWERVQSLTKELETLLPAARSAPAMSDVAFLKIVEQLQSIADLSVDLFAPMPPAADENAAAATSVESVR